MLNGIVTGVTVFPHKKIENGELIIGKYTTHATLNNEIYGKLGSEIAPREVLKDKTGAIIMTTLSFTDNNIIKEIEKCPHFGKFLRHRLNYREGLSKALQMIEILSYIAIKSLREEKKGGNADTYDVVAHFEKKLKEVSGIDVDTGRKIDLGDEEGKDPPKLNLKREKRKTLRSMGSTDNATLYDIYIRFKENRETNPDKIKDEVIEMIDYFKYTFSGLEFSPSELVFDN